MVSPEFQPEFIKKETFTIFYFETPWQNQDNIFLIVDSRVSNVRSTSHSLIIGLRALWICSKRQIKLGPNKSGTSEEVPIIKRHKDKHSWVKRRKTERTEQKELSRVHMKILNILRY